MTGRWQTIDRVETRDGPLELRSREDRDFLITVAGRVLMNSHENRSELALATLALAKLRVSDSPRVLIGGLGMGCTLRAALDRLPEQARVCVAELNAHVVRWCSGPLASTNRRALEDPRVEVRVEDVAQRIAAAASDHFDAILLDLYEGPHAGTDRVADPFYGSRALDRTRRALAPGGVFALWSEAPDDAIEERLRALRFEVERHRPGRGGRRHNVTVACKLPGRPSATQPGVGVADSDETL
jgi:spermidine synthase